MNTNTGTANTQDEEDCDEFIEEAIQMLDILGLDLITYEKTEEDSDVVADDVSTGTVPDGIYSLSRKLKRENKVFTAKMQVAGNCFIVLKGSMVCPSETQGLMDYVIKILYITEISSMYSLFGIFDSNSSLRVLFTTTAIILSLTFS